MNLIKLHKFIDPTHSETIYVSASLIYEIRNCLAWTEINFLDDECRASIKVAEPAIVVIEKIKKCGEVWEEVETLLKRIRYEE